MLSIVFFILLVVVFGKLVLFAFHAAWGIAKILLTLVFLPVILVAMVLGGLIYLAMPILLIVGIFSLIGLKA